MNSSIFSFLIGLSLITSPYIFSQENWSVEFKPGIHFPVSDEEIKTGFGFGLSLGYDFLPHLGAYAGWGWQQFKSQKNLFNAQNTYDVEETGYMFGLQFINPFSDTSDISYLLRLGGIYNHFELETSQGNITADSGHGFGWEAGAGIELGIGMSWFLRPQLAYRSITRKMEIETVSRDFDLNYITLGVGIAKKF